MAHTTKPELDLAKYRETPLEKQRTADLVRLLPKDRRSVLEIGARDAHFSNILAGYFETVTALDLERPEFEAERVITVKGDVTRLEFPDNSFDCTFCAEVLEHVPDLKSACAELTRVTRHELILGVPYDQDLRLNRLTCSSCGKTNSPWGHVNSFDEKRIRALFPGMSVTATSFVGSTKGATNAIASLLMEWGGNPWGPYYQREPCVFCGALIYPAERYTLAQRICSGIAGRIDRVQTALTPAKALWIHAVLVKK
jgi:SAM-dependent methyltransferase